MRISESDIRREALREMLRAPGHRLTTSELINRLTRRMNPTGLDNDILSGRSDTYFSQKVRNLVSHRNQSTGLVARGHADYDPKTESWTLTKLGRAYVSKLR